MKMLLTSFNVGDNISKIPGVFRKWGKEYFPHFECSITINNAHRFRTFLLLDTGSPFTPITPKDYLRTRIRVTDSNSIGPVYLAACHFSRVPVLKNVVFKFQTDNRDVAEFKFDDTIFLVPSKDTNQKRANAIPSIIGLDFLRQCGLKFYIDPQNEITYLETNE